MKKRTVVTVGLVVLAAIAVFGGLAYAASIFTKTLEGKVKIRGISVSVATFSNSSATSSIDSIDFPDVIQGNASSSTFYVKNVGNVGVSLTSTNTVPGSVGTLEIKFDGEASKLLPVDGVAKVDISLKTASNAPQGNVDFDIGLVATPATGSAPPPPPPTSPPTTGPAVSFSATIQPLLSTSCVGCHGTSGGVTLSSYSGVSAVVSPGNAAGSLIYKAVTGNGVPKMPLVGANLSATQIQAIADWINQGALNN